jgi:hypothetical protein
MKVNAQEMINEMDDGIKYFDDEILGRLRSTAKLI